MPDQVIKRITGQRTLSQILPKGSEGGREFARIVDLLLFHEARSKGKTINIFNDASGDYYGMDSFGDDVYRESGKVGYQYKFFPSPLSDGHRSKIKESLKSIVQHQENIKIRKWILVMPEDLLESARKKGGGDVSWFQGLKKELNLTFDLEHMGHEKLLKLFIDAPSLCLFYYPELVPEGGNRRKTIQSVRVLYDENIDTLYRYIEFIGMSVYKQEATSGVPMEDIYIPLSAIPEGVEEKEDSTRTNPLDFLKRGARHVILGDPGSGKSTLLKFLALSGIVKPLQEQKGTKPDTRLPILVFLRRYADDLKKDINTSLFDYILKTVRADTSMNHFDKEFLEYYLESGEAILLFDGLDELPNPQFKKRVRDRIRTFITTYPGNTCIVTSRIVGYDASFRFDEKEFRHFRLTKLQITEIEQFVNDWYKIRVESSRDRQLNIADLMRIIRDESQTAIRELARNPLLLTIITLVHRIDAVLPDERVVLYEKCTETLLNTWHTWKYRESDVKRKGKAERRNQRRIETIAAWMHERITGEDDNRQAIVPYSELKSFLTKYIEREEKPPDPEKDPEDLAEEFLEFVRKKAGLLIEIGDGQYSFVHLTFQEYLTAVHITKSNQIAGMEAVWKKISKHCREDGWLEVIRLLVALCENPSQEFLIGKMLAKSKQQLHFNQARLLGGLLLDNIDAAIIQKRTILKLLFRSTCTVTEIDQVRAVNDMLRVCRQKDADCPEITKAYESVWSETDNDDKKLALVLTGISIGWSVDEVAAMTGDYLATPDRTLLHVHLLLGDRQLTGNEDMLQKDLKLLFLLQDYITLSSNWGNLFSSVFDSIMYNSESLLTQNRKFLCQISALFEGGRYAPFFYRNILTTLIGGHQALDRARGRVLDRARGRVLDRARGRVLDRALARARAMARTRGLDRARALARTLNRDRDRARELTLDRIRPRILALARDRARFIDLDLVLVRTSNENFWDIILDSPDIAKSLLDTIIEIFGIQPAPHWYEALRTGFLPKVPERLVMMDENRWKEVEAAFETGTATEGDVFFAAWMLLYDCWLYFVEYHSSPDESIFRRVAELTSDLDAPPLRIAHCIRDLAYGDESRGGDLEKMVKSDEPAYREIFEACYWRATPDEEARGL